MADPDEVAARRLQEQIWLAEAEEGNDDDNNNAAAAAAGGGGGVGNGGNNNAGAMQDFVRQLLANRNNGGEGNNNNNNGDNDEDNNNAGDDDGEEEDDDADDDDDDDDDDNAIANRGAIDGGIAGEVRDENSIKITRSLKCPLILYFECAQELDELAPSNPMLKQGTTVYIGLDKNTKLEKVFNQYIKFVNSKIPKKNKNDDDEDLHVLNSVKLSDLEFLHCTLLDARETVEASALMKNDRIKVYHDRSKERSTKAEIMKQQRDSDRKYFKDLRQLLPNPSPEGMGCDVVLDCRGKILDERGYSQNVLATTVRANSVLISKRCKWLGQKISSTREDVRRRAEMTVDDEDDTDTAAMMADGVKSGQSDDEDDIIMGKEPVARAPGENDNNNNNAAGGEGSAATKVEDYDDDDEPAVKVKSAGKKSPDRKPVESSSSAFPNSIWVSLDHSPQAVKLLLEYCYTNRVQSLGRQAFVKGSKYPDPKEVGALAAKQAGPVPPFSKNEWPDGGNPTVSLHLALAGVALAEEAHMPRLSLMCEIAASKLVNKSNVIDVLSACQVQQQKTGNRLPILRKAAMLDCILKNGSSGVDQLYANENFKNSMNERRGLVIPSLLDGTAEVLPTNMNTKEIKRKKDKMALDRKKMFEVADGTDRNKRLMERLKWRNTVVSDRRKELAYGPDSKALRMPSSGKNIWRDSYQRDPPPLNQGRGSKRKAPRGGATASDKPRVRRRTTRKTKNSLA